MNYVEKTVFVSSELDLNGSSNVIIGPAGYPFEVSQIRLLFSVASTGSPTTVTVTKRITTNTDSGAITLGTFAVASGYAVGDEALIDASKIYKASTYAIDLNSGEQLKFTSGAGLTTGKVYISVIGNFINPGPNPVKTFTKTTKKAVDNGTGGYAYLAFTNA